MLLRIQSSQGFTFLGVVFLLIFHWGVDGAMAASRNLFPKTVIWLQNVGKQPVHADSGRVVRWMAENGNSFDPRGEFHIDLSLRVLEADETSRFRSFEKSEYYFDGECDDAAVPLPPGGTVEGNRSYRCEDGGDCHLIVIHRPSYRLFEMWKADISSGTADGGRFEGGCMAVWDFRLTYGWETGKEAPAGNWGRGLDCTSADAAGLPIAPLLFTSQELADGRIDHALRFVLPNRNIRSRVYTAPATHATVAAKGPESAPPYGARFRLKADRDLETAHPEVRFEKLPKGARVIVRALQQYGMFLADGGAIALTGESDYHSAVKYCGNAPPNRCDKNPGRLLHEHDLAFLRITDFEMLDSKAPVRTWQGDCRLRYKTDDKGRVVPVEQ